MAALFQTLGLSAAIALSACGAPAEYEPLRCNRHDVQSSGASLTGIEDMAALDQDTLLLSAYNRSDIASSPKGLFTLSLPQTQAPWQAKRLTRIDDTLVPHGIALTDDKSAVYVIDRSTSGAPRILRYQFKAQTILADTPTVILERARWGEAAPYPCNMNDMLVLQDGALVFTNDRASCFYSGKMVDNALGRHNGSLWQVAASGDVSLLQDGLYFPNGLARRKDSILVAQTRDLSIFDTALGKAIPIPGAPDNITASDIDGEIWIAAFPSLTRYALFRAGFTQDAGGSLILKMAQDVIPYSTPSFSGATTALKLGSVLYISGAYTDGILACEVPNA